MNFCATHWQIASRPIKRGLWMKNAFNKCENLQKSLSFECHFNKWLLCWNLKTFIWSMTSVGFDAVTQTRDISFVAPVWTSNVLRGLCIYTFVDKNFLLKISKSHQTRFHDELHRAIASKRQVACMPYGAIHIENCSVVWIRYPLRYTMCSLV